MKIVETIAELRHTLDAKRTDGKRVGFVPTMGALHEGHSSLVRTARSECDIVVVSIFVNPLQFGPNEDLDKYPRTWDADLALAEELKADIVFHPSADEMYPGGKPVVRVSAGRLGDVLCGRSRLGHFDGVATVVAKLFNAIGECRAYFGRKDAQQLVVIQTMARNLNIPVEVIGCETVREPDGLALSSRNRYLGDAERRAAPVLHAALREAKRSVEAGERDPKQVAKELEAKISSEPLARLDYAACVDAETLSDLDEIDRPVLLAAAAWFGQARLIDNETATPSGAAIREA